MNKIIILSLTFLLFTISLTFLGCTKKTEITSLDNQQYKQLENKVISDPSKEINLVSEAPNMRDKSSEVNIAQEKILSKDKEISSILPTVNPINSKKSKDDLDTSKNSTIKTISDLQKDLENTLDVCNDMRITKDSPIYDRQMKKIEKLKNLIEKVKMSNEKDLSKLLKERDTLYESFQNK